MASIFRIVLLVILSISVSACGIKGKLKTPEQIEKIEAKKAAEVEKKVKEEAEKNAEPAEQE